MDQTFVASPPEAPLPTGALVVSPALAGWMDPSIDGARRETELAEVFADLDAHPWPDDIASARRLYDEMGPPVADDIAIQALRIGDITAQLLTPPDAGPDRVMLFLHGGGYVYGSLQSHAGLAAELARHGRCLALQIHYRLAPENRHPAAVEDACAAYRWLLRQGFEPHRISIVGDSAGGGLVVAALLTLKEASEPLPGAAVCISPWVDLELTGDSYSSRAALDPMVERSIVELVRDSYLSGQDPRQVTASPILGDLRGLPPMLVQVGEREILYSDAEMLAHRAAQAGIDVTFETWPQMVHVWHLYFPILTAAREAIARIGGFLLDKTSAGSSVAAG